MTRKDYILIAEVLKNFPTYAEQPTDDRDAMAYDFADRLEAENPRFDRERFLVAAGVLVKCDKCESRAKIFTSKTAACSEAHAPKWVSEARAK